MPRTLLGLLAAGGLLPLAAALGALSIALTVVEPAQSQDVLSWGYEEWRALSPAEQDAYLAGFVTGAAVVEAGPQPTPDSLSPAIARLRTTGRLTFDLGSNLYSVRMAEYYFWENHRTHRIAQALYWIDRELAR